MAEMVFGVASCELDLLGDDYAKDQSDWGDEHRLDRCKFERIRERCLGWSLTGSTAGNQAKYTLFRRLNLTVLTAV